jgi:hypothetical protein
MHTANPRIGELARIKDTSFVGEVVHIKARETVTLRLTTPPMALPRCQELVGHIPERAAQSIGPPPSRRLPDPHSASVPQVATGPGRNTLGDCLQGIYKPRASNKPGQNLLSMPFGHRQMPRRWIDE